MSGGKGSGKLPARANNVNKKATRKASWANSAARKSIRIEKQRLREQANKALRSEGLPTKWETLKAKQANTRNKHYNVGTASYVLSAPKTKLAKGQMNPGRATMVRSIRLPSDTVDGYSYACLNCGVKKRYTYKFFQFPYEVAVREAVDHMCNPDRWAHPENSEFLAA